MLNPVFTTVPDLVLLADGGTTPEQRAVAEAVAGQLRRRLPGVEVSPAYADGCLPTLAGALAAAERPSVVVPLQLATDERLVEVVPRTVRRAPLPTRLAPQLGPHPLLAAVVAERLQAAGARRGDPVLLVAPATRDADGVAETLTMRALLQRHWGAPVRVAALGGAVDRVPTVLARMREEGLGRAAVAPYLLAPGPEQRTAVALAAGGGCTVAADVLGAHRLVVELVARRYRAAVAPVGARVA